MLHGFEVILRFHMVKDLKFVINLPLIERKSFQAITTISETEKKNHFLTDEERQIL